MTAFTGTYLINLALPVLIGAWLGRRTAKQGGFKAKTVVAAIVILFALLYLNGLRSDWLYLNTYWEGAAPLHVFGPDWSKELLMRVLKRMPFSLIIIGFVAWVTNLTVKARCNEVDI